MTGSNRAKTQAAAHSERDVAGRADNVYFDAVCNKCLPCAFPRFHRHRHSGCCQRRHQAANLKDCRRLWPI